MPTEQRVLSTKPTIGARPTGGAATDETPAPAAAGRKKLVSVVAGLALVLGGGAGYWFVLGPGAGGADAAEGEHAEEPAHEPGEVLTIEPVSINLANGRYLRLGLGLQLTADVHGSPSSAQAIDLAIALFSGRTIEEVSSAEGREALKAELLHQLEEAYHGEVMDVYLTDYVTQ